MYYSSADFSGWLRLKSISHRLTRLIPSCLQNLYFFLNSLFVEGGGCSPEPRSLGCAPDIEYLITLSVRHWSARSSWYTLLLASSFALGKPWVLLPRQIDRKLVIQGFLLATFFSSSSQRLIDWILWGLHSNIRMRSSQKYFFFLTWFSFVSIRNFYLLLHLKSAELCGRILVLHK
jgi:hypothetical protein